MENSVYHIGVTMSQSDVYELLMSSKSWKSITDIHKDYKKYNRKNHVSVAMVRMNCLKLFKGGFVKRKQVKQGRGKGYIYKVV